MSQEQQLIGNILDERYLQNPENFNGNQKNPQNHPKEGRNNLANDFSGLNLGTNFNQFGSPFDLSINQPSGSVNPNRLNNFTRSSSAPPVVPDPYDFFKL